jgi:hypothetical protein
LHSNILDMLGKVYNKLLEMEEKTVSTSCACCNNKICDSYTWPLPTKSVDELKQFALLIQTCKDAYSALVSCYEV